MITQVRDVGCQLMVIWTPCLEEPSNSGCILKIAPLNDCVQKQIICNGEHFGDACLLHQLGTYSQTVCANWSVDGWMFICYNVLILGSSTETNCTGFFLNAKMFSGNDFFKMIEWVALVNKSLWLAVLSGFQWKTILKWWMSLLAANLITDWDLRVAWVRKSITVNTMSAFIVVKVTHCLLL